ncbi:MAG TPA: hypothetical protein VJ045_12365 [Hyphomicrobiaceae bacterium]|nr:hypothetical protein [Hyphomicrobiaceae bacterium]
MSALGSGALARPRRSEVSALATLALVRIAAAGGATRADIAGDLAPLVSHKLPPAEWRRLAEREIGHILAAELASETRGRLAAADAGALRAARFLGHKGGEPRPWAELRDIALVAKGLGVEGESSSRVKVLSRLEGLRALIVQKAYGLPLRKNQPPAKLRAQLAVVALERAFGNKIKAGFGKGSALSSKAGRLLAGQLSQIPRDFGTDAKLIAHLAAEHVGAKETDLDALRLAILRQLGAALLEESRGPEAPRPAAVPRVLPPAANDIGPAALQRPKPQRPDLAEFARAVKAAARGRAEGWPGHRKAYIAHVWQAMRGLEPDWDLSEIEFKCMLAEAHRVGQLVLANADLKDKKNIKELESSAVLYKNTVWHFVRVEE